MAIIGAILGDIAGSQYEYDRPVDLKWKECNLFTKECCFTDDTVMTIAVKYAIDHNINFTDALRSIGQQYPLCGYGNTFFQWMFCVNPKPYGSYGNGSAMRVAYIGEYFEDIKDVIYYATKSAAISHNHKEGIKGAVTTAVCIWMAKHGNTKEEIYKYVLSQYPFNWYKWSNKPLEYLRKHYSWDVTCMSSIPVAMRCFYEANSYESFLRNVFSLNCDMDTLCTIGGGVAEEYFGINEFDTNRILYHYLDRRLINILKNKELYYRVKVYKSEDRNSWRWLGRSNRRFVNFPSSYTNKALIMSNSSMIRSSSLQKYLENNNCELELVNPDIDEGILLPDELFLNIFG